MPNRVGQQLGSYRLVRLLGWSPFAEVYLAKHIFLDTWVAIKVLQVQVLKKDLESFTITARRMTELVHPHIIQILEFGMEVTPESSTPFLVMEYASNGSLRQRHPIGSRLTLATILPYVKQIAEALHHAHLQKLIHGDVKPENISLGSDNQLLLSDFSTALISSSIKRSVGTMAYMAPEQIRGQPCPLSDEYALGAVIYEWLCGELPFYGSLSEISNQHLFATPPPLHTIVPDIPPAVEEVVLIALAKDPERRFVNLLAFANALEQASLAPSFASTLPGSAGAPPVVITPLDPQSLARNASTQSSFHRGALLSQLQPASRIPGPLTTRISRRAVIVGLPGLIITGSGILAWLLYTRKSPAHSALSPTLLTYRGHFNQVTAVAWSPDGKFIASGGNDHTLQVWNAKTGSRLFISHGQIGGVPGVAWSPDSTRIASASAGPSISGGPASDNTVRVWNVSTGKSIYTYHGHSSGITGVAWSPGGKRIASSSTDYTIQIWDAMNGQHPLILRAHSWYAWTVAWSPDGKHLASGGPDEAVRIWDAVTGRILFIYYGSAEGVEAIAWSPDGSRIASSSGDFTVRVWNSASGSTFYIYRGHTGFVHNVAWSPNGKYIASGSSDKTVQIWEATTGNRIFTYSGHIAGVNAVVWSPDSKYIASGSEDGTVQVWRAL
jgi:eukaryotic-like serine/threonine-protein kinase